MQDNAALGTFNRRGEYLDVTFERHYPRGPASVWSALTEPDRLADWMGRSAVEPRVGGRYDLMLDAEHPMTGRILVWEPPSVLEVSWSNDDAPNSTIRYELTADGAGTRMRFVHRNMPYVSSARMLPGWHTLFARLADVVAESAAPSTLVPWGEMRDAYIAHYHLVGVALDRPAENLPTG